MGGLGAEGLANEPLERGIIQPGVGRSQQRRPRSQPDHQAGHGSAPAVGSIRNGPGPCEGLDHATLHGLANLGMEGMIGRPVDPPLAIEPHQSAALRFGRIGGGQPRQRIRPVEIQLQPEGDIPDAPGLGGSFPGGRARSSLRRPARRGPGGWNGRPGFRAEPRPKRRNIPGISPGCPRSSRRRGRAALPRRDPGDWVRSGRVPTSGRPAYAARPGWAPTARHRAP